MKNIKFLFLSATVLVPAISLAWGDLGHKTVAELAYRKLTPAAVTMVNEVLGVGSFVSASVWPDMVRSDDRFNAFDPYHFITIDPKFGKYENIPIDLLAKKDSNAMIEQVPQILFDRKFSFKRKWDRDQRKMMMRYYIHLVGDVHQPLHVGQPYDRGGNLCSIKVKGRKENLHSYWDEGIVNYIRTAREKREPDLKIFGYFGYFELANLIESDKDILALKNQVASIESKKPTDWYNESHALHAKVYPDKVPYASPIERPYCRHLVLDEKGQPKVDEFGKQIVEPKNIDEANLPELDENALLAASDLAKVQIYKASLRLAYVLNELARRQHFEPTPKEAIEKKLESIQLKN